MLFTTRADAGGEPRGPIHPDIVRAQDRLMADSGRTATDAFFDDQIAAERARGRAARPEVIAALEREKLRRRGGC